MKSSEEKYSLFTDGGARGNPGPGAIGVVLKKGAEIIFAQGRCMGEITNNQGEYSAIIGGLEVAKKMKISNLECFLDSELVVKQLNGEYKVKDEKLKILFQRVKKLEEDFDSISFNHVPREKNKLADKLVNEALDKGAGFVG